MAVIRQGDGSTVVDMWTVAVYKVEMRWGGPEEGGWWRTMRDLVAIETADSEEAADALSRELLDGKYRNTGRSLSSVNFGRSGGDQAYALYVSAPGEPVPHDLSDSAHWD